MAREALGPKNTGKPAGSAESQKGPNEVIYESTPGTNIIVTITVPGIGPYVVGTLQTLSYSVHTEKFPVKLLGHKNPVGFTNGPRTCAGTLIFTFFNKDTLLDIVRATWAVRGSSMDNYITDRFYGSGKIAKERDQKVMRPLASDLPPFDIFVLGAPEISPDPVMCFIKGLTIIDEGAVISIDDLITETTYSYLAKEVVPLDSYSAIKGAERHVADALTTIEISGYEPNEAVINPDNQATVVANE